MKHPLARIVLITLSLLAVGPVGAIGTIETAPDTSLEQQTIPPQQEQNRRELKTMLWAAIIILIGLFVFVFSLFIIRMARTARGQHLDKKREPTEYIDAWGQYRLPDDAYLDDQD